MGVTRWVGNDCWLHYEILWESEQETVVYERVMVCMIMPADWGDFFREVWEGLLVPLGRIDTLSLVSYTFFLYIVLFFLAYTNLSTALVFCLCVLL
jgi:hypothetical protein